VATFPKGFSAYVSRVNSAAVIARAARDTGGSLAAERDRRRFQFATPADLRGLPAVGRGCGGGAIRGTRPGDGLE
jgi:hypothetical protein